MNGLGPWYVHHALVLFVYANMTQYDDETTMKAPPNSHAFDPIKRTQSLLLKGHSQSVSFGNPDLVAVAMGILDTELYRPV